MYRPSPSFAEAREDRLPIEGTDYGVRSRFSQTRRGRPKKKRPLERSGEADMAAGSLDLPVVDLASPDLKSVAEAVRKVQSHDFSVAWTQQEA
jgi:hypothetical protein